MGLLSFLKRRPADPASLAATDDDPADASREIRTRARRRLIGAVVLVAAGIIVFPLIFETQPRPIPIDIPIEIPRKDALPPLAMPPAPPGPKPPDTAAVDEPAGTPAEDIITERRADAGRELPAGFGPASAPATGGPKPAGSIAAAAPAPEGRPASSAVRGAPAGDGARAQALLDGKDVAKADAAGRFIVQVGAFAEATAAQEARSKIERLGLKTYTQVATTPSGSRIRVRLGPFANRDEADRALARAKSAGLGGVVLTL